VSAVRRLVLNDAQTSGGLLIAAAAEKADSLMAAMRRAGIAQAAVVGRVGSRRGSEPLIRVRT
jgi:selenide,water dikinase